MANGLKNNFFCFFRFFYFFCFFLCLVFLWLCWETPVFAKEAIGWHWYNEIYPENKEDKKDEKNRSNERNKKESKEKSAMLQMALLRQTVREAKARAILYPTEENMRSYLILQNFVMGQANMFTHIWEKTLLDYPELDYSVLHPTQNNAQHVIYAEIRKKELEAISAFSKKYGLLFFYRGNNPLDQELAPTIESFSKDNNISLIPVSIDGKNLEVFATSHADGGQAEKLGIKYFPALILVDPKNQKVKPLNYGFISDSDLRRRFLQVATDFQEGV